MRYAIVSTIIEADMTQWQTIVSELQKRGWTQEQLAAEAGTVQSVISDLRRGKVIDPRYSTGRALERLLRRRAPARRG